MKRETAYKVRINDILQGNYVVQEGWNPNYIEIGSQKVSRTNIIGIITQVGQGTYTLDDGTANINMRSFDEVQFNVSVGDVVLVIGRPREYQNERLLVPEIIRTLEDKAWIQVRNAELNEVQAEPVKKEEPKSNPQKILEAIQTMDSGSGVSTEELMKKLEIKDDEVQRLIEEGELYEVKPGILKLLS